MKRIMMLIAVAALYCLCYAKSQVCVVDERDNSPVVGATVIDGAGIIVGATNGDGNIALKSQFNWPLTIKYLGYESLTTFSTDTIKLIPATYELKEVVVSPIDRPIKRVLCFVREYSSGIAAADTTQTYSEYMAEAYIAEGKVKGYKKQDAKLKAKVSKHYARIMENGIDSIFAPEVKDNIMLLSWFENIAFIPKSKMRRPEAIKAGAMTDTLQGVSGPLFVYKKKNNLITRTADVLSDHKDRKWSPLAFKMLGLTLDVKDLKCSFTYMDNDADSFGVDDLVLGTFNISLIGRGKFLKKVFKTKHPIEMNTYMDIYPVDITNCTVEEYKELRESDTKMQFQKPGDLQPMSPAIQALVERIEREVAESD